MPFSHDATDAMQWYVGSVVGKACGTVKVSSLTVVSKREKSLRGPDSMEQQKIETTAIMESDQDEHQNNESMVHVYPPPSWNWTINRSDPFWTFFRAISDSWQV